MEYYNNIEQLKLEKSSAVSVGKFEAVHIGHQKLIGDITSKKNKDIKATVITFKDERKKLFTDIERRIIFEKLGIDVLLELKYEDIKNISADDFLSEILLKKLNTKYINCGGDFKFGKGRLGDTDILKDFCRIHKIEYKIFEKVKDDKKSISSSMIKKFYLDGNLEKVNAMLNHTFFLYGKVVDGNKLGRTIGVPTANVNWPDDKLLPPKGVYACKVCIEGKGFYGVANIGNKPTIGDGYKPLIEVHILDFSENIYGQHIFIHLFKFIRDEEKFRSVQELKEVLNNDVKNIKVYFDKKNNQM